MRITVVSYEVSGLNRKDLKLDIPPLSTVKTIVEKMNIPAGRLVVVNGTIADHDRMLVDGDELRIFPQMSGG